MTARLEEIGFEMPIEDLTVKYRPTAEQLDEARAWGARFGEAVLAREASDEMVADTKRGYSTSDE